ncbi:unnamed protein product, partial [Owenia fusiformis]
QRSMSKENSKSSKTLARFIYVGHCGESLVMPSIELIELSDLFTRLCGAAKDVTTALTWENIELAVSTSEFNKIVEDVLPKDSDYIFAQSVHEYDSNASPRTERTNGYGKARFPSGDDTTFDQGGSPLKLQDFGNNHLDDSEHSNAGDSSTRGVRCRGVSALQARNLVSAYSMWNNPYMGETVENPLPLWVVCDGREPECIAYMGCHIGQGTDQFTCKTYIVTAEGAFIEQNLPQFAAITKFHNLGGNNNNIKTKCSVEYDLFGNNSNELILDQATQQSFGTIQVAWDKVTNMLQRPPMDSTATALLSVVSGDKRSTAYSLYKELTILQGFYQGLNEEGVSWAKQQPNKSTIRNLKQLIEGLKSSDNLKPEQENEKEDTELDSAVLKRITLEGRKDLDFTDRLWDVLIDCTSYVELVDCLNYVLKALRSGDLQPMVHKTNRTSLAKLVQDSYYNEIVLPTLEGDKPLQMLVEIGIEKLRQDYISIFVGKELAMMNNLECFINKSLSLKDQLMSLEKLHNTLELVVTLKTFINLPQQSLSIAAREALYHFQNNDVHPKHIFRVPIKSNQVGDKLESLQPRFWQAEICSEEDGEKVHTIVHISNTPSVSHVPMEKPVDQDAPHFYITKLSESLSVM